jgi:RNA polymerase sigma factor (sigma-70 family)
MSPTSAEFYDVLQSCFREPEEQSHLERLDRFLRPRLLSILVALYRTDPSLAEDAYQSAFIRYIQIFKQGQKPSIDYEGYFVAIAKNCLIDEIRRLRHFVPIDQLVEEELALVKFRAIHPDEARIDLLRAISMLDARCRFILQSYYIEEMETPKLAQHLNMATDSVHMALKRCRDRLRGVLGNK